MRQKPVHTRIAAHYFCVVWLRRDSLFHHLVMEVLRRRCLRETGAKTKVEKAGKLCFLFPWFSSQALHA